MPPSMCSHRSASIISTSSARSSARGPLNLLGPVAVGASDYLHHMTVRVIEIDPATTVQMIDLAGLGASRIGVADKEGVMPRSKRFARIEIESHAVRSLDWNEMAPFRPRFEIEDIGEEFGRDPFVLRRDDRVIEF